MQNFINNFIKSKFKILLINILLVFIISNNSLSQEIKKYNNEFKSLKSDNANMRVGPGKRFEILWNFKKPGLPVKILKKFEQWYEVETPDGSIGWMWGKLLSNKQKTVLFKKKESLYERDNIESNIIAYVNKNAILKLYFCKNNWCKVESKEHKIKGFVKIDNLWGAYIK
ncbi:MAG: hypothetical protein CMJ12_01340 [Pelagibacterales bacterium]|nr:hypothetical protein [Pelagibacterales bacterium]PPR15994.1 MAG: hypothetical protein CFH33_01066 [Alphaproteobacteria bacterium MarineAlpha9_Bin3]